MYMNIYQISAYCRREGLNQTADYFEGFRGDEDLTYDTNWIEKQFVKGHFTLDIFKKLECECLTWMI
jgi:hypothetical protein